jgi:hypothetical protein
VSFICRYQIVLQVVVIIQELYKLLNTTFVDSRHHGRLILEQAGPCKDPNLNPREECD